MNGGSVKVLGTLGTALVIAGWSAVSIAGWELGKKWNRKKEEDLKSAQEAASEAVREMDKRLARMERLVQKIDKEHPES